MDIMCIPEYYSVQYTLSTCAGRFNVAFRHMRGIVVESLDESFKMELTQINECNNITNERPEIPTPEVVDHFEHLGGVTIAPLNKKVDILLLIGREIPDVHHVLEHRIGPKITRGYPLGGPWLGMYVWVTYRLRLHLRVSTRQPSSAADDQEYLNPMSNI